MRNRRGYDGRSDDIGGVNDRGQRRRETERHNHIDLFIQQGFGGEHAVGCVRPGSTLNLNAQLRSIELDLFRGINMGESRCVDEGADDINIGILDRQQFHDFFVRRERMAADNIVWFEARRVGDARGIGRGDQGENNQGRRFDAAFQRGFHSCAGYIRGGGDDDVSAAVQGLLHHDVNRGQVGASIAPHDVDMLSAEVLVGFK